MKAALDDRRVERGTYSDPTDHPDRPDPTWVGRRHKLDHDNYKHGHDHDPTASTASTVHSAPHFDKHGESHRHNDPQPKTDRDHGADQRYSFKRLNVLV